MLARLGPWSSLPVLGSARRLDALSLVGLLILASLGSLDALRASAVQDEPAGPGVIKGVVRDEAGYPVGGATVVATGFGPGPDHQVATTDITGRFAFSVPKGQAPPHSIVAYKQGLAPASKVLNWSKKLGPPAEIELVLPRAEPFVGIIQDRDGRPVASARVQLRSMLGPGKRPEIIPALGNVLVGTPLAALFEVTTDPAGEFRFPAVPAPPRVHLRATAAGMADLNTENFGQFVASFLAGCEPVPAQLTMVPEARIAGRLTTKLPGVGVGGLNIGLQGTEASPPIGRTATTDAEGWFELRGLPETEVNIFPSAHPPDGPWTYEAVDRLRLKAGTTHEVTIELIGGVLVEGLVVDTAGRRARGTSIGMYGPARPRSGAAIQVSDPDHTGRYRFRLPPGETYLYIFEAGPCERASLTVTIPVAKSFTAPPLVLKRAGNYRDLVEKREVAPSAVPGGDGDAGPSDP